MNEPPKVPPPLGAPYDGDGAEAGPLGGAP